MGTPWPISERNWDPGMKASTYLRELRAVVDSGKVAPVSLGEAFHHSNRP